MADSPPEFDPMSVQPEHRRPDCDRLGAAVRSRAARIRERLGHCQLDTQLNFLDKLMGAASEMSEGPSENEAIEAEKEAIQALQEVLQAQNEVIKAKEKAVLKAMAAETKAILCEQGTSASQILEQTSCGRDRIMSKILEKMA